MTDKQMNKVWRLARTPTQGWPQAEDFGWSEEPLPEPGSNQMLTRTIYLSLDPYQWGRRRQGVEVPGVVCHGRTVSQVLRSRLKGFDEGDLVFNTMAGKTLNKIKNTSFIKSKSRLKKDLIEALLPFQKKN